MSYDSPFVFQLDSLEELLTDFYTVTHHQVGLFDLQANRLLCIPPEAHDFCQLVQSSSQGKSLCRQCDRTGCAKAIETGTLVCHPCHAGLLEICAPIRHQEKIVGFLMFGHLIDENSPEQTWPRVSSRCRNYGIPEKDLQEAFRTLPAVSLDYIRSLSHLLETCVEHIQLKQWIASHQYNLWTQILNYIDTHLTEPLTLNRLCRELLISTSTLTRQIKLHTHLTPGQYINRRRLELACVKLCETDLSIAQIAEFVGIPNYNYFSRIFRKVYGKSPREYRLSLRSEDSI